MMNESAAVALWDAPAWANYRVVDEGAIEHCLPIGEIGPIEGEEPLTVEVVQRDELNLALEPASISRTPAQIRLGGLRLSVGQVRDLVTQLNTAVELIDA